MKIFIHNNVDQFVMDSNAPDVPPVMCHRLKDNSRCPSLTGIGDVHRSVLLGHEWD